MESGASGGENTCEARPVLRTFHAFFLLHQLETHSRNSMWKTLKVHLSSSTRVLSSLSVLHVCDPTLNLEAPPPSGPSERVLLTSSRTTTGLMLSGFQWEMLTMLKKLTSREMKTLQFIKFSSSLTEWKHLKLVWAEKVFRSAGRVRTDGSELHSDPSEEKPRYRLRT